ncbi:hypothetical protein Vretimale_15827 [Volvox reticuliferus]|uniref:Uncharacterized protein n=1 Tax=Volvox reticuliferus TaxID=1737510 RepID=A0A8J4GS44_9CHLO|nr:hypothetical protein Vretifemale_12885 [Volvox reticuliferus]GIM12492.1 hypothetical protein Vretimale_15827 [Volvox reticuliferus]
MSPGEQVASITSVLAESIKSGDDIIKSSVAASTTGAIAVVRQPRASSATRREEHRTFDRRVSSDVIVTSTKHVAKPWKQERAAYERRGHSQTGEQGGELRLTHERLQQYAAAHARLTAPARPGPRSTAGSTLLRKITNLGALMPSPLQPQQLGPSSPTGAVAAAVVRTISSAPVLSPSALSGARLALTTPGVPPPGMGPPTGARPASAQRPQSPRQLLQRLISFPQAPMLLQQQQRQQQQGAPPPERAFGPRAADYPTRHASPRPVLPSFGFAAGGGADYSWQPHSHQPHPPANAKQRPNDPRVTSGRGQNGAWTQHLQIALDSPIGAAGLAQDQGRGSGGWDPPQNSGYAEATTAAAAAVAALGVRDAKIITPPGSPPRPKSPLPAPPMQQQQQQEPKHQYVPEALNQTQQPQQQPHSAESLPHFPSPQSHPQPPQPPFPHYHQLQVTDHLQDGCPPNIPAEDRRLRPWTPRGGRRQRPQSSGPGTVRWGSVQMQGPQPGSAHPGKGGDVVVVGLRDVPPSQLPFARAVMEQDGGLESGQQAGRISRSSDNGTHASWWHGPRGDSEASYPLTAVTDRNGLGEDDMTPSEAAMWLSRMAELEAEVLEEREFRRKYEEELRMLAAAATAGGRGSRPSGGGPMLWQTTGGRVVSGARAAAAAVMRHRAGVRP